MTKKREEEQFVVTDRRKFSAEGERLSNAPADEVETAEPQKAAEPPKAEEAAAPPATQSAEQSAAGAPPEEEAPLPPTAAEQTAQSADYKAMGKKIDDMIDQAGGKRPPVGEVNFESLINSLSMQAMIQLGVLREEGAPMRPDIIGARGTIDILSLLAEKTKGNLTDRESNMLQSALFELRMAFLEITRVMTQPPPPDAGLKK